MADTKASLIIELKDKATQGLNTVSGGLNKLKASWVAVTAAIAGFVAFAIDSVKAFTEEENAISKLNIALQNQGMFTKTTSNDLRAYASQLQSVSTVGDETIINQMALLTTFGLADQQLKDTTKAALDLSKGLGIDLNSATLLLGKAFAGDTATLSRYGIKIKEGTDESEKFNEVMKQVNERFGGSAQAELETTTGKIQNFTNRIGDLKEKIGAELIPIIDFWLGKMEKVVSFIEKITSSQEKESNVHNIVIDNIQKEIDATKKLLESGENLDEKERARLENKLSLLEQSVTKEISKRDEQEEIENQREQRKLEKQAEIFALQDELKAEKDAKDEEKAVEKHEKELERLDEETATIIEKFQTREEQKALLEAQFGTERAAFLNKHLSDTQKAELLDHTKKLTDLKKFNEAKTVEEAAYRLAQSEAEKKAEEERKKREEERKANFSSTLNFISSLSSSKSKELAAIGKASAISIATMDTFQAANKALASAPPPFNFALMAGVIAAGLANVAKIGGVALAEGGIVQPRPGGTQAIIGEGGRAEAVIPLGDRRAQEQLGGLGNNITLNINAGLVVGDEESFNQLVLKIDEQLFNIQRSRQSVAF